MGIFTRKPVAADHGTAHTTSTATATTSGGRHGHHYNEKPGFAGPRPSFGQWLRSTWLDLLTMAALGAVGLGVYRARPAPSRSFPVNFIDGEIVYPEFAYPLRHEIIPIWLAALLASLIPIFIFLVLQFRIRSFWDLNNAVLGLLYSLITAAVFQVFIKWLIGGLRPHFLAVCKPQVPEGGTQVGNGYRQIMYDRKICTGDDKQINDSLESFPSGHATAAFAGFIFLSLYLNGKLKLWSDHHTHMWKQVAVFAPVLGAILIAGTLTIDQYHNWYDLIAGATIGTVMALSSYRMVYAAIWNFRYNHVPLLRTSQFLYDANSYRSGAPVFTRGGVGDLTMGMAFMMHTVHLTLITVAAAWTTGRRMLGLELPLAIVSSEQCQTIT